MRWEQGRRSDNVEDMRGRGGGFGGGAKLGLGSLVVIAAAYFLGVDPRLVMGIMEGADGGAGVQQPASVGADQPLDAAADKMRVVLADTEDTWSRLFQAAGRQYTPPHLLLYERGVQTGCGTGSAAAGPFYCPADQRVYLDLSFFDELAQQFHAPGDFAQAYVLAHEVGHHVQLLLGIEEKVRAAQQRASETQQNMLQVRMELQADCFAGVWAHYGQQSTNIQIEPGDVDAALTAAAAVGDDTIQKRAQGYVVPESFTHGSAQQRQQWFERGFQSGQIDACDTFGGA